MDPGIPDKIRSATAAIRDHGVQVDIQVDGGIRRQTVPLIQEAGAGWIVPGSLMFGEDPAEMRRWLAELGKQPLSVNRLSSQVPRRFTDQIPRETIGSGNQLLSKLDVPQTDFHRAASTATSEPTPSRAWSPTCSLVKRICICIL